MSLLDGVKLKTQKCAFYRGPRPAENMYVRDFLPGSPKKNFFRAPCFLPDRLVSLTTSKKKSLVRGFVPSVERL